MTVWWIFFFFTHSMWHTNLMMAWGEKKNKKRWSGDSADVPVYIWQSYTTLMHEICIKSEKRSSKNMFFFILACSWSFSWSWSQSEWSEEEEGERGSLLMFAIGWRLIQAGISFLGEFLLTSSHKHTCSLNSKETRSQTEKRSKTAIVADEDLLNLLLITWQHAPGNEKKNRYLII